MEEKPMIVKQLESLIEEEPHWLPVMANASALLFETLPDLNWAGFYLVRGEELILGPFQGKPACIRIPYGKGVCGTAWQEDCCIRVPDVHEFPGHIACDSASNAEIVLPLHVDGKVVAVLDIDSPVKERFTAADEEVLLAFANALEEQAHLQALT